MTLLKKLRAVFLDERELIVIAVLGSLFTAWFRLSMPAVVGLGVVAGIVSGTLQARRHVLQERRLAEARRRALFIAAKAPACAFDPQMHTGTGMLHCPECGEMVLAGQPHPDYSVLEKKE